MNFKNRFCFRIAKEAGVGKDADTNEPVEAYIEMSVDTQKFVPQKVKDKMVNEVKEGIAAELKISPNYLTPITPTEYDANAKKPE